MSVLKGLKPEKVFYYFEEISNIPRQSGNEKAISDYLKKFAEERNLYVRQDEKLNIIMKKPGTKGYEKSPSVIIQGHMDMVCEKNGDYEHDFTKDPLKLQIAEDFISAEGTTLGADNGIAVAYGLALVDSEDIPHPPLEFVITTDEEVGLTGAMAMDTSDLDGKYFVNLDSEEEGELVVSCAGGLKCSVELPVEYDEKITDDHILLGINVKGLKGGHSGMEIDKNRANANRLTGRILCKLNDDLYFDLVNIYGGMKDNVIPRESFSFILIKEDDLEVFNHSFKEIVETLKNEFKTTEPEMMISSEEINCESSINILSEEVLNNIIFLLMNLPSGVQAMSQNIEGLVESSLNLGKIVLEDDYVKFVFAIRSSVRSKKYLMAKQLELCAKQCKAEFATRVDYPEWEFRENSKLLDICVESYKALYGEEPIVKGIHAGLESGVFLEKLKDADAIALGPNMFDVHSPDERVSIASIERTWDYLLDILKRLK